jgi:hypothetical protein
MAVRSVSLSIRSMSGWLARGLVKIRSTVPRASALRRFGFLCTPDTCQASPTDPPRTRIRRTCIGPVTAGRDGLRLVRSGWRGGAPPRSRCAAVQARVPATTPTSVDGSAARSTLSGTSCAPPTRGESLLQTGAFAAAGFVTRTGNPHMRGTTARGLGKVGEPLRVVGVDLEVEDRSSSASTF